MKKSFEEEINQHGFIVYTNVGDSMLPLIRERKDLLVIKQPPPHLKKYDIPLCKINGNKYILHRILKVRKEDYVLCGDNRWKREYGITDENIIGILSCVVKDGKQIDMNNKKYRLYVHLWCDFFFLRALILWFKALPQRVRRKLKKL